MRKTFTTQAIQLGLGVLVLLILFFVPVVPARPSAAQSTLTLTWSADVVVPTGYRGRALPVAGSTITVEAHGYSPALNYAWDIDNLRDGSKSGPGRSTMTFITPPLINRDTTVTVTVQNDGGNLDQQSIRIPVAAAHIGIRGMRADGLVQTLSDNDTFEVPVGPAQFYLQPYFLQSSSLGTSTVRWTIGKETTQGTLNPLTVTNLSVTNRGPSDITTPLRVDVQGLSSDLFQLLIKGVSSATTP